MNVGGELWRKDVLYDIMDGKSGSLAQMLDQDPELKRWKCKQAGDECVRALESHLRSFLHLMDLLFIYLTFAHSA